MNAASIDGDALLDHFQRRVIADALQEATRAYWQRRAATFDAARPRPGDYPGRATPQDLAAQDTRLAAAASACRDRADAALIGGDDS